MSEPNGNRTHEPSLRELTAEMDGLRELMEERNKWYGERDRDRQTAVDKALAAVEKQTAAAFEAAREASTASAAAQKEAITKEEKKQEQYNISHNDLVRKMDEQNKATMPRTEAENRFKAMEEKIALLTGSFSAGSGAAQGAAQQRDEGRANIGIFIAIISGFIAIGSVVVAVVKVLP